MDNITKTSKILILILSSLLTGAIIIFWGSEPQYIIYSMSLYSLLVYLVIRAKGYKDNDTPEDFFLYNREMPKDEFVPTFVTTNIGLFSSIAFSVVLSFYYGIGVMLTTTLAWFIGMYWFSKKIPNLLPFLKKGTTIHEYIAESYGKTENQKNKLRVWTSIVSAILYFASVGVEIKFAADLLAPSIGDIQSTVLAFLIAFIGFTYTYLSGYKGVVLTDKIQYYLLLVGGIVIIIFSILIGKDNNFSFTNESFKGYFDIPFILWGPDPWSLPGLLLLLVLYQFCIMDMWQRCIAISKTKELNSENISDEDLIKLIKKKTFKDAIIPFSVFFAVWFLIGLIVLGSNLTNDFNEILFVFLSSFNNYGSIGYLAKAIVITAFIAAVMSTIDTFLLATVQTLMYDIYGTVIVKNLTKKIDSLDKYQQYRFVNISKHLIIIIGIVAVGFAFLSFGIVSFWTTMYSIMLSFFPAVYISLNGKANKYRFNTVLTSIIVGSGGALIFGFLGTFIIDNSYFVSFTPIFAVFSSLIIIKSIK